MSSTVNLNLLIKEIKDPYVQENFLKLKQFLDCIDFSSITPAVTIVGGSPTAPTVTSVPKLTDTFDTAISTLVGELVVVTGLNFVSPISDNDNATIPHGVFGIAFKKPSPTRVEVLFMGLISGFTGFTPGLPLFVSELGVPTHTKPATGTVQQIGFATRSTDFFLQLKQPLRQS